MILSGLETTFSCFRHQCDKPRNLSSTSIEEAKSQFSTWSHSCRAAVVLLTLLLVGAVVFISSPKTLEAQSPGQPSKEYIYVGGRLIATEEPASSSAISITSISPIAGTINGGTSVTITGNGFQTGATVTFGGMQATNVMVVNSTSITANTPPHAAGAVNVVVTASGQSSPPLSGGFTYSANPAPTISTVVPNSGSTAGGTSVTINGSGFLTGATVTFGGTSATNVTVQSGSAISATAPAHTSGATDVVVKNPDNQVVTLSGGFTYTNPPPTITSVSPTSGSQNGGTSVTISGTGFVNGATVTFGGTAATVGTITATTIAVTTPTHIAGTVNVVVTNPDSQSATLTNGFTYTAPAPAPTITSISPNSGSYAGGTSVTITGSNYQTGATVTLGGTAATGVTVASSTSITATTPAHAVGAVNVVVTNPDSQSATLTNGYTYTNLPAPPTVTAISPSSGTNNAAISITSITGSNFALGWDKENGLVGNWRMDEINGSTLADSSGNGNNGTASGTTIVAGKINNARSFNGSSDYVFTNTSFNNPTIYSVTAWFKTGTTSGGKIVGFGNFQAGSSINYDRHIYMGNVGRIHFGAYNAGSLALITIDSSASYNDSNWHFVAATMGAGGMALYIDSTLIGTNPNTVSQNYTGYWRIGYDSMKGWTDTPSSDYFNGIIDEVRVYNRALSGSEVQALYNATTVPSVALSKAGQTSVACSGFTLMDSGTLTNGTCNITAAPTGAWNVAVTDADQQSATLRTDSPSAHLQRPP